MVATSQHEFVSGEQVVRKVVAYSHVKSDCWYSRQTEEACSACCLRLGAVCMWWQSVVEYMYCAAGCCYSMDRVLKRA